MKIEYFIFSGTGNTLKVAEAVGARLSELGCEVAYRMMEENTPPQIDADAVVGLAFPLAFFSSYPLVQNFVESLPRGNGRRIFMTSSMGGMGMGVEGRFRALVEAKGYAPCGSRLFRMSSNYGSRIKSGEQNKELIETMEKNAKDFAENIVNGTARWSFGIPFIPSMWYGLVKNGNVLRWFYKAMPLAVDGGKCVKCMRCVKMCPAGAINAADGVPSIDMKKCQCCQRCAGFCPVNAIKIQGKDYKQYSAMSFEEFHKFFKKPE